MYFFCFFENKKKKKKPNTFLQLKNDGRTYVTAYSVYNILFVPRSIIVFATNGWHVYTVIVGATYEFGQEPLEDQTQYIEIFLSKVTLQIQTIVFSNSKLSCLLQSPHTERNHLSILWCSGNSHCQIICVFLWSPHQQPLPKFCGAKAIIH